MDFGISQEGCFDRTIIVQRAVPATRTGNTALPWEVPLCGTRLNPHFLFVLPKRLPGFPAELYRFGTEKPGGYSLLKRECPPRPPKEKRGGDFDFPPHPLETTQRGGLRPSPLETPLRVRGAAAGRGAEGVLFAAQRMPCPQMRGRTQVIWVLSAQPAEDF